MPTPFDRRRLLRLSATSLAAAGLAPWLASAFGQAPKPRPGKASKPDGEPEDPRDSPRGRALADAWTAAQARGRPLLVLVVPRSLARQQRGRDLGAFLLLASDEALADLALCEIACATLAEFRAVLPEVETRFEAEPLALLVDPDGGRAEPVREWFPPLPKDPHARPADWRTQTDDPIEEYRRRAAGMAREFHAVIAADRDALARRAADAAAKLGPKDRNRLATLDADGRPWSTEEMRLCPAWALACAADDEVRQLRIAAIAKLARADLVLHSPRGARWGHTEGGCGDTFLEDPPEETRSSGPCGTAMMPPVSLRFLWLYTKNET